MHLLLGLLLLCLGLQARADEVLLVETRPGVQVPVFHMPAPDAKIILLILPGGGGSFGQIVDGQPNGLNFLVRTRRMYADAGYEVAIMGRALDTPPLDNRASVGAGHVQDIGRVIERLQQGRARPVWLVGSSRGTVSATAAAIALGPQQVAGLVLTSSVVSYFVPASVTRQSLDKIQVPVLVVHHDNDGCSSCAPRDVHYVIDGLRNAPVKKLVWITGGGPPEGDVCEALHLHSFIGAEPRTAALIADWIRRPEP